MLRTRSPVALAGPLDLHVLSTPPAFTLSQDQTLHKLLINQINLYVVVETDIFVFNYLITKLSLKFIDKLINIFYNIYILFNFFTFNNHYI